jgi:hypothetical protein
MPDVEQQLLELGASLEWPATPQLAARVRYRVAQPSRAWYQSRWAIAAIALLIALAALVAYTPTRDVIARWFNLHANIQRTEHPPTPSPLPPGPLGERLGLGNSTTLDAARAQVKWTITVPKSLGDPDEVYLQQPPDGPSQGEVTLVYSARPGIPVSGQTGVSVLITEARGAVDKNFFGKMLGPDTTFQEVTVNGHPGYWIAGKPHVFFFTDASGQFRNETLRLATNTLIFDNAGTVVRIEGDLTKAQALEIAQSLS